MAYYIGIDIGTGSARAALVSGVDGSVKAISSQETRTWRDPSDHRIFEQSTTDIWHAICTTVQTVLREASIDKSQVKGIGLDATCSLAVTDEKGDPVCVTKGDGCGSSGERNIILWADHRAEKEAERINATGSVVLDYVGGTMSLEMEIPKILWLKSHIRNPANFSRCQFFDLPDFFTYHMTGSSIRSTCSLTCKCSFIPEKGWQRDFFSAIGLESVMERDCWQIGAHTPDDVLTAGLPVGNGLTERAAKDLGLDVGTPVGSGVIDAYAGWIGTIAARYQDPGRSNVVLPVLDDSRHRLALVAGTSTCHLVQSPEGVFVPGVWGPYKDSVFPGWWMNEGGQSSTGQLIDFVITTHHAYPELQKQSNEKGINIHQIIFDELERLRASENAETITELTKDLHIYPDLHGNRSPIADSRMRGSIVGLSLDSGLSDLARKYNATLESIALQTRHIVDEMNTKGHSVKVLALSGGQARNRPLVRTLANVCGAPVLLPKAHDAAVVLGSAMLGRMAAESGGVEGRSREEQGKALWDIMVEMTPEGSLVTPDAGPREKRVLEAKYKIFHESIEIQQRWRKEMEVAVNGS